MEFGRHLRRLREAAALSQEELAERAGLSARGISDLERGLRHAPYPATLRRLAAALNLATEDQRTFVHRARPRRGELPMPAVEQAGRSVPPIEGGFLGAVPPQRLVARTLELDRIRGILHDVQRGRGRLVLVEGEAGIGKTRLAQEVAREAVELGFQVTIGRCYETQADTPFYPFFDALATLYASATPNLRESVPRRWPYLQLLLPDYFGSAPPNNERADESQRLLRAVTGFAHAVAARAPVALLLDDIQWLDATSLELLLHLARHSQGERVLLFATCRVQHEEPWSPVRRATRELDHEGLVEVVSLGGLDLQATTTLMADRLGASPGDLAGVESRFLSLVHSGTEGNPFFVVEVLRTLLDRGDLFRVEAGWEVRPIDTIDVPESVRAAIAERRVRLPMDTIAVLEAAAVLGQTFGFDDLVELVPSSEVQLELALAQARRVGLVRQVSADVFAFDHALSHRAVYEEVPQRRRHRLHLAAANVLERLPTGARLRRVAELAQHLLDADAAQRALPFLLVAGEHAETLLAHPEAERHYRRALALAVELGDRRREAEALEHLAAVVLSRGHHEESSRLLERALEHARVLKDVDQQGRVIARMLEVAFGRGLWEDHLADVPALVEELERRGPSRALALLHAAQAMVLAGKPEESLQAARRSAGLAAILQDDDLRVSADVRLGFVLMNLGQLQEALQVLENVLPLAEARNDYYGLSMAFGVRGEILKLTGAFPRYMANAEQNLRHAEQSDNPTFLLGALVGVAEAHFLLGEWTCARVVYDHAEQVGSQLKASWYTGFVHLGLGALNLAEGNWERAEQNLSACLGEARRLGHHDRVEHAQRLLAKRDILAGQPCSALERLEHLTQRESTGHTGSLYLHAWAALEADLAEVAQQSVARALALADARGNQLDLAEARLVQVRIFLRQQRLAEADRQLAVGLDLVRTMPHPFLEAQFLELDSILLAFRDEREGSTDRLKQALTMYEQLGARWHLAQAALRLG